MAEPAVFVAVGVMLGVYVLLMTEAVHRTAAALLGVGILLVIHFLVAPFVPALEIWQVTEGAGAGAGAGGAGGVASPAAALFDTIIDPVDWNVVFLLLGMMIIVAVTERTGIFQFLAVKAYEVAGGRLKVLVLLLLVITAVSSAFLDNVTTMLLMTPVTIELCVVLGISPVSFLLPMVFASNIGGAATLIGDPPNILVGSHAGLTFNDFLLNLAPVVAAAFIAFLGVVFWQYRRDYRQDVPDVGPTLARLQEEHQIRHKRGIKRALAVLALVIALFFLHGTLEMEVSLAALIGAAILLPISRVNVVEVLHEVEWPTLVFFIALFILVGAVEQTGFLAAVADAVEGASGGSFAVLLVLIIWVSAFFSAAVDNIPFTAVMLPVVADLTASFAGVGGGAVVSGLWWALVLGADLGGNATLVGASANIVTVGLAERAGYHISFLDFMKKGVPITLVTCLVATVYVLVAYGGIL